MLNFRGTKRKVLLTSIQTVKIDDIYVKLFYLMEVVYIRVFFTFKVREKTKLNLG